MPRECWVSVRIEFSIDETNAAKQWCAPPPSGSCPNRYRAGFCAVRSGIGYPEPGAPHDADQNRKHGQLAPAWAFAAEHRACLQWEGWLGSRAEAALRRGDWLGSEWPRAECLARRLGGDVSSPDDGDRLGSVQFFPSAQGADRRAVGHRTREVDALGLAKLREQHLVQTLPHAGSLPAFQPSPAGHP